MLKTYLDVSALQEDAKDWAVDVLTDAFARAEESA